jgi:hypothetical protein
MPEWHCIVWMHYISLIHSSIDEHLYCFHILLLWIRLLWTIVYELNMSIHFYDIKENQIKYCNKIKDFKLILENIDICANDVTLK